MKKMIFLLLTFLLWTPLFATSISNKELLEACQDKGKAPQNFCYGFIISAANAAQFYRNIVDVNDEYIDICFPEDISNKEIVDLYISWAQQNLSLATGPAFIGVSTSFSKKYSCSPKKEEKKESLLKKS